MAKASFLNTSHQTLGWFADQKRLGRLTIRPPFQRRPVWTPEQSAFLIDSVLRGYPVPEIYVYAKPHDGGFGDHTFVVDGQQRLKACLDFMDGLFPINFDLDKISALYTLEDTPWYGKRFSELSPEESDTLRRYKLIVRDLEGVTDDEIRHMFHRLNQSNMALNAQELRYSMYAGGMLGVVEELVKLDEWDTIKIFTPLQRRRMLDSEYVAELIIGLLHWPQNKKDNLDHYFQYYAPSFPFSDRVVETFAKVLNLITAMFPGPRMDGTRWYRKSDFYTLFLALARGRLEVSTTELADLRRKLTSFSSLVSNGALAADHPAAVYKESVERAASDRGRRVRREEALLAFLSGSETFQDSTDRYLTADELVATEEDDGEPDEEYEDS